jgi:hypothetical protein
LKNCKEKGMKRIYSFMLTMLVMIIAVTGSAVAQSTFPGGINYQAVARDNNGDELVNTDIEVRFSIRTGSPTGAYVYQEVFTDVTTSRYGVFSLIIGKGEPVIGTFADIDWSTANHYLQVEVKFENVFMDMGTMQFMAVPYALYAAKSLEPGPQGPPGPQGEPGDPASDDQQLSYDAPSRTLSLTNSGSVTLGAEVAFRAKNEVSDPATQLSEVTMTYDAPDLSVGGGFNPGTGIFTAPSTGIYTFNVSYFADGSGGSREVLIFREGALYEKLAIDIGSLTTVPVKSVTMRLVAGETAEVKIYTGTALQTGTGTFAGYKVD